MSDLQISISFADLLHLFERYLLHVPDEDYGVEVVGKLEECLHSAEVALEIASWYTDF